MVKYSEYCFYTDQYVPWSYYPFSIEFIHMYELVSKIAFLLKKINNETLIFFSRCSQEMRIRTEIGNRKLNTSVKIHFSLSIYQRTARYCVQKS